VDIQVQVRKVDGVPLLDVAGELDLYTSPKLKAALDSLLAEGHTRLIVNLLETTYLDSTALSVLTATLKQVREAGGNLGLIYTQPQIERMFTITGLDEVFPIFRGEADAVNAARAWGADAAGR